MTDARAVVATAYGEPDVLAVRPIEVADPGPGQVLVEVRAAGVNPIDWKAYSGMFGTDPANLPMRLGAEAAGVVVAVGAGASGPAGPIGAGDEVIAYRANGAYATHLLLDASAVVPKPAALDFAAASGLLLTGATAVHLLTAAAVGAGDTVLVHGGSGGVGLMAVQLAGLRGARVIATASAGKHELLRELGATPVEYGTGLRERVHAITPNGVDAAIDAVGTDEAVDTSVDLVPDRSRIASAAAFGRAGELGIKLVGSGPGADPGTELRDAARLELVRLVDSAELRVLVAQTFPLDEAADAHREIKSGHTAGKIALVV